MTAKTLMVMGTHSNAGKSLLVTALCRIFARRGLRVAPFKAQNMALNAGVTPAGDEIGRATIAQAEAAGIAPHVDMNPVLLKPESDGRSQIVLDGKPYGHLHAENWHSIKPLLWRHVTAALDRLRARTDLVIIEGAGSPAEINLKAGDIVNMRVAQYAGSPVLLVGDIDRGGVFAALVGTMVLLEPAERALVKAFVINKFRGDIRLLGDGLAMLQARAFDTPTLGVLPFLPNIGIAAEDSVMLDETAAHTAKNTVEIAVIRLPHISNFDDFDPLAAEADVSVRYVSSAADWGNPAAVILPGTKTTLADLVWLQKTGLAEKIRRFAARGGNVAGICGGYQMLGETIADPHGAEAAPGAVTAGLSLLPLKTVFGGDKRTVQVTGKPVAAAEPFAAVRNIPIHGYEIHMGRSETTGDGAQPLCAIGAEEHPDGLISADGRVWGTYLHGIFENDAFRHAWLRGLGWRGDARTFDRNRSYDRLADHVAAHLDMAFLQKIINGEV